MKRPRIHTVSLRLDAEEYVDLKAAVDASNNRSLSEYVREAVNRRMFSDRKKAELERLSQDS